MTWTCEVITARTGDAAGGYRIAVADDYPADWTDTTDQQTPPYEPGDIVALGQHLTDAQMTALSADVNYYVNWAEVE